MSSPDVREGGVKARRKSLRSQLYRAARDLGNVDAVEKGPSAYGKRVVRRTVYRKVNGSLGRGLCGGSGSNPTTLARVSVDAD